MPEKKDGSGFLQMKGSVRRSAYWTSYDYPTSIFAEKAGSGHAFGRGLPGHGRSGILLDRSRSPWKEMILHAKAVRRGAPDTFIVGDMPFMSYHESVEQAVHNAGRFYKEARWMRSSSKEAGEWQTASRGSVDSGMSVMGHIGLTPQSSGQLGGFKAQGRTPRVPGKSCWMPKAVEKAGAFSLLLEAGSSRSWENHYNICKNSHPGNRGGD